MVNNMHIMVNNDESTKPAQLTDVPVDKKKRRKPTDDDDNDESGETKKPGHGDDDEVKQDEDISVHDDKGKTSKLLGGKGKRYCVNKKEVKDGSLRGLSIV